MSELADAADSSEQLNDLEKYFFANDKNQIDKWRHYFEVYERHFSRFRGKEVTIVEFGVYKGGSLQMWKDYFGPKAKIYGVDINPHCKVMEEEDQIEIFIGDQEDKDFLQTLVERIPKIDILIDDGGHSMAQQIATYEVLFPHVKENGVYLCEDLHTSYWSEFKGGYKATRSYIEFSKDFIDYLHGWYSRTSRLKVNDFTRSVHSLHYYDSILVVEKRPISKPFCQKTGTATIPDYIPQRTLMEKLKRVVKRELEYWKRWFC